MITTFPHDAFAIAASLFAGLFMLQLGLRKRALRWRVRTRCPSCGRIRRSDGRCDRCAP